MLRLCSALILGLFLLAACTPAGSQTAETATSITGSVSTASIGTAGPVILTSLPPDYTPPPTPVPPTPTFIPTLPGGLGPTELKYRILAQFPDFFFCAPTTIRLPGRMRWILLANAFP